MVTDAKPWESEPDQDEFEHAGLLCVLRRNPARAWCGYVLVPPTHPLHGKDYTSEIRPRPWMLVDRAASSVSPISLFCAAGKGVDIGTSCPIDLAFAVHGGLTFARTPWWNKDSALWAFGFDCSHAGDLEPGRSLKIDGDVYRDIEYVRVQARLLAEQLQRYEKEVRDEV